VSWTATGWAIQQLTGSSSRKVLLLALAHYADKHGVCWPSQETLARGTEQSVDTVQRQLKKLQELGLIDRERMPKRRGQWQGYRYRLRVEAGPAAEVQNLARTRDMRSGQAATDPSAEPQSLRLKPSIEPSYEPSRKTRTSGSAERLLAFQKKQEGAEVVQNRIACRIGNDGWLVLGEMNDAHRSRLCTLERQGRLDDETLMNAVLEIRLARPR
jgi:DNA-binding transcriptional ArsR family regulator